MKKLILIMTLIALVLFVIPLLYKRQPPAAVEEPCEVNITVSNTTLPLEDYLAGVIAGEMPASFAPSALEAQAIAARTYVIQKTNYGAQPIEPTTAHQVFIDEKARQEKWLATFAQYEEKITAAVKATEGQIILYNDTPISAMFHASSNGQTETAANYSGNAIPYLQSVSSPEEDIQTTEWTMGALNEALATNMTQQQFLTLQLTRNETNRVQRVSSQTTEWTGRQFRDLLKLRSTDFTFAPHKNGIAITTKGYGHGVGMSQHGANELAKQGMPSRDIILHYYPQTTIGNVCTKK